MTIETIRLRRAALGCVLEALPKWRKTGIRIANHSLKVNGERREWLTVFRKDGSLILWEHFPEISHARPHPGRRYRQERKRRTASCSESERPLRIACPRLTAERLSDTSAPDAGAETQAVATTVLSGATPRSAAAINARV